MFFLFGIFLFFLANHSFADENSPVENNENSAVQDETAAQPAQAAQPARAAQPAQATVDPEWKQTSSLYRKVGWGLFGGGLGLSIIGTSILLFGGSASIVDKNEKGFVGAFGAGATLGVFGGLSVITGIVMLIVDAVKFNPYRRGEISNREFKWEPRIICHQSFQDWVLVDGFKNI